MLSLHSSVGFARPNPGVLAAFSLLKASHRDSASGGFGPDDASGTLREEDDEPRLRNGDCPDGCGVKDTHRHAVSDEVGVWLDEVGVWLDEVGISIDEVGISIDEVGVWLDEVGVSLVEGGIWLDEPSASLDRPHANVAYGAIPLADIDVKFSRIEACPVAIDANRDAGLVHQRSKDATGRHECANSALPCAKSVGLRSFLVCLSADVGEGCAVRVQEDSCEGRLRGATARGDCEGRCEGRGEGRLRGATARGDCEGRLRGATARGDCEGRLRGATARGDCEGRLRGATARGDCEGRLRGRPRMRATSRQAKPRHAENTGY